jgi:hypothetical protein
MELLYELGNATGYGCSIKRGESYGKLVIVFPVKDEFSGKG